VQFKLETKTYVCSEFMSAHKIMWSPHKNHMSC